MKKFSIKKGILKNNSISTKLSTNPEPSLKPTHHSIPISRNIKWRMIEYPVKNGASFNFSSYTTNEEAILKLHPELDKTSDSKTSKSVTDPIGLESTVKNKLDENLTNLYRMNENIPIAIEYEFKAPNTDEIYLSIVSGRILDYSEIYVNGIRIADFGSNTYYSQLFRIGSFEEGADVKVSILCKAEKSNIRTGICL